MEDRRDSPFIDELLEASLAQYRSVEPRPGLEHRILAQLRAEPKALLCWAWAWRIGAGLVTIGVLLAIVSITYRQRPHAPVSIAQSPKGAAAVAAFRTPATVSPGQSSTRRRDETRPTGHAAELRAGSGDFVSKSAAVSRSLRTVEAAHSLTSRREPRRDVFPSPAPLSEEEKLLVSYVRQWRDGNLAAFPKDDQPVASLRVSDLNIRPLEMKELSGSTTDQTR